jgi:hypothetical protein
MINLAFESSVPQTQRLWCVSMLALTTFPRDLLNLTVNVATGEPPCPGHSDYMCTTITGANACDVVIRGGVEDPGHPANRGLVESGKPSLDDVRRFFIESFAHEVIGHGVSLGFMSASDADKTALAGYFRYGKTATGEPPRNGVLADWNPLDRPWEDRIQEAVAEFLKDVYVPETVRFYEQRTNWDFVEENFDEFLTRVELALNCTRGGGA